MRSHCEVRQNAVHCKYPDVVLKTVKSLSVERWTLLTLNGRHLGYVAEGAGPRPPFKHVKMAADDARAFAELNNVPYRCQLMCQLP